MSNFGNAGQFDDGDVERQLQEEFRRRQLAAGHDAFLAGGRGAPTHPPPPDYGARLAGAGVAGGMMGEAPYYAAAAHHAASPYTRVTNPYAGLAEARAAYQQARNTNGAPVGVGGAADPLSQIYARQRQQHQAVQQAVASNYAYGAPAGAGPGSVLDQYHAAAYGIPPHARHPHPYNQSSAPPPPPPPPPPPHAAYGRAAPAVASTPTADMQLMQQQHSYGERSTAPPGLAPTQSQASASFSSPGNASAGKNKNSTKSPSNNSGGSTAGRKSSNRKAEAARARSSSVGSKAEIDNENENEVTNSGAAMSPCAASTSGATGEDNSNSGGGGGGGAAAAAGVGGTKAASVKHPPVPERTMSKDGKTVLEDGVQKWYTGCVPLGLEDDKYWLSELQVYLRANFAEAFGATEEDIAAPMHGRNKPIALGQVGIRCMHCKRDNPAERGQQATSYPSLISGIYNSVQQMLRLHMECCVSMPAEVRNKIEALKLSCSSRGGRKQYWIDSAKRLGLVDTTHGIHFGRDPRGPLPPLTGPSVNSKAGRTKKIPAKAAAAAAAAAQAAAEEAAEAEAKQEPPPPVDTRPLVFEIDKPLISDYLYLTLEQMAPCLLMEADRVGCYKTRKVGFPGLACKHCVGQAGCGRYFPASEASLSQTTTSQTIMNHVRNCRRCPHEIRETLEIMKRNRMGPDGKRADKPKHGGRKVFFHRLWCRIQGLPFDEDRAIPKESKRKKSKKQGSKKRKKADDENGSDEEQEESDDEETESEEDEDEDEGEEEEEEEDVEEDDEQVESKSSAKESGQGNNSGKKKAASVSSPAAKKKAPSPWFEGCVTLTKGDDPHWLSEMECFARSDLVEVFSFGKKDALDGYGGRKEPSLGQVGIRCVYCKDLDPSERPNGCIIFPDAISSIHAKVADMIRLHFPSCPSLPDDAKRNFKSLRGFDAKVANDDSLQYWIDSARDIGLSNIPPGGSRSGSWGVTFRRDPLQPSPADELDLEATHTQPASAASKNLLVRPDDRGLCTDQVMLMLRQVRPCRFKNSDRRAGPGARGRDRSMGFAGLCCMHCVGKNTLGRYFPVSAKNLTDSTANSLQSHLSTCSYCPEPIKASLAYLGHRSILQKAELSGSWKKAFFKKIWERLHVEREWDENAAEDHDGVEHGDDMKAGEADADEEEDIDEDDDAKDDDGAEDSDEEKEEMGNQMNALIKAAAIWLTNEDKKSEQKVGRGTKNLPTKRRRVHY